jgi:hypothetical protein
LLDFNVDDIEEEPDYPEVPLDRKRPVVKVVARGQPKAAETTESAEESDERAMAKVEFRLELAQYYRLVLSMDSFFSDSSGPAASVVDKEIRDFVRTRMSKLVGVEGADSEGVFTPAEVTALKALAAPAVFGALSAIAAKVTRKPSLAETPAPTLKKAVVPAKPALRKVSAKSIVPSAPAPTPTSTPTPPPPTPAPVEKVSTVKRAVKTVSTTMIDQSTGKAEQREVEMDLTQQARPTGNIQPIPFPTSRHQTEMMSQMTASRLAEATNRAVDSVFTTGR